MEFKPRKVLIYRKVVANLKRYIFISELWFLDEALNIFFRKNFLFFYYYYYQLVECEFFGIRSVGVINFYLLVLMDKFGKLLLRAFDRFTYHLKSGFRDKMKRVKNYFAQFSNLRFWETIINRQNLLLVII